MMSQETIRHIFDNAIIIYGGVWLVLSFLLVILSIVSLRKYKRYIGMALYENMLGSPLTPGISVIIPSYNNESDLTTSVRTLLTLNYPQFEVIVVNDGSTDGSLRSLIEAFALIPVDYVYPQRLHTQTVRELYLSSDPAFSRLRVIDKVHRCKADAINAGLNMTSYDYFLRTDPDGILDKDILLKLIKMVIGEPKERVIAVGTTWRAANDCTIDKGVVLRTAPPRRWLARFGELSAIRKGLLWKMGRSLLHGMPVLSGGPALFDKTLVLDVGGFDPRAFDPDTDLLTRMDRHARDERWDFAIRYVPETLSWKTFPSSLTSLGRERTLYFTFLTPIVEAVALTFYLIALYRGMVNPGYFLLVLFFMYSGSVLISFLAIYWDQRISRSYRRFGDVLILCSTAVLAGVWDHPLTVVFTLKGYVYFLIGKKPSATNVK
jgi:cellulose synthase/poly-beta-1,6-N-acetylglucosamine synthase-like glycosyltransferase